MPSERLRESIVPMREPEVTAQWLEKMKKPVRYTWNPPVARTPSTPPIEVPVPPVAPAPSPVENAPALETLAPSADTLSHVAAAVPVAEAPAVPAAPAALTFDSIEDARLHLLANARDKRSEEHTSE